MPFKNKFAKISKTLTIILVAMTFVMNALAETFKEMFNTEPTTIGMVTSLLSLLLILFGLQGKKTETESQSLPERTVAAYEPEQRRFVRRMPVENPEQTMRPRTPPPSQRSAPPPINPPPASLPNHPDLSEEENELLRQFRSLKRR